MPVTLLLPDSGGDALLLPQNASSSLAPPCGLLTYHRGLAIALANLSANGTLTDAAATPLCMYFMPFHDTVALVLAFALVIALLLSGGCGADATLLLFLLLCTSMVWEVSVPVLLCVWWGCCWRRRQTTTVDYAPVAESVLFRDVDMGRRRR